MSQPYYQLQHPDGTRLHCAYGFCDNPRRTLSPDTAATFLSRQPIQHYWGHLLAAGWTIVEVP